MIKLVVTDIDDTLVNSNKSWLPNNENFICNVQHDINKKFEIRNKLVDEKLKPERVGSLEYKWNPNFK